MKGCMSFYITVLLVVYGVAVGSVLAKSENAGTKNSLPTDASTREVPVQVNGVFPNLTVMADGMGSDSEAGIGALIPWGEKLWAIGYVSHIKGEGLGLYEISENMTMRRHPDRPRPGTTTIGFMVWQYRRPVADGKTGWMGRSLVGYTG